MQATGRDAYGLGLLSAILFVPPRDHQLWTIRGQRFRSSDVGAMIPADRRPMNDIM